MIDRPIRVALDAMGGDVGVTAAVEGAAELSLEDRPVQVFLVGDEKRIGEVLAQHRYDPAWIQIVHAPDQVGMDEHPAEALERHPEASILRAAALVSAGHTGATILAASQHFERLPGIRRAALASVYPTEQRHGKRGDPFALMLDVGATLNASEASPSP